MIVIVGGGLAGLAAAHKFVLSGYLDFILVEAQDVIGGRVKSIQLDDGVRLDLGAQWLHGYKENPIYDWLQSLDLIDKLEQQDAEFEGLFVTSDGQKVPSDVVSKTLRILLNTKNRLYRDPHMSCTSCLPVGIFRESIREALLDSSVFRASDREIVELVQRWFELHEAIDNSCERLEQLSMRAYSGWSDFDDGKMVRLKGGWQRVVNELSSIVGKDRILLNSKVEEIHQRGDARICISLSDQDSIICDHVILTQSVRALKDILPGHEGLFPRGIVAKRWSSIEKIGFGPVNKIFLQFAEPCLQEEGGLKVLHRNMAHPKDIAKSQQPQRDSSQDWTRGVLSFELIDGAPNVLLVWVGGVEAAMMEHIPDTEVIAKLLELLTVCLPEKPPPNLVSIRRSAWSSNPSIGGAYSYPASNCAEEDLMNLWEPICDRNGIPKLLFAGEATAGKMYATAHGAIISGWREADRLLKLAKTAHSS